MSKNEDKIILNIKPDIKKEIKTNSEIPDFEDEILISNPYKYYLYCEGKREAHYLKSLKTNYFNSSRLNIELFKPNQRNHEGCDAKSLIDQFIAKKKERYKEEDYDENENKFFLIFDRDNNCQEPEKKAEKHLSYCLSKCIKFTIKPIFSNPCFEVWLICQYKKPQKKDFPSESRKTKRLYNSIKELATNKNKDFEKKIFHAKRNAKKIYDERIEEKIEIHSKNSYPVTEIFQLIKILEKELDLDE